MNKFLYLVLWIHKFSTLLGKYHQTSVLDVTAKECKCPSPIKADSPYCSLISTECDSSHSILDSIWYPGEFTHLLQRNALELTQMFSQCFFQKSQCRTSCHTLLFFLYVILGNITLLIISLFFKNWEKIVFINDIWILERWLSD